MYIAECAHASIATMHDEGQQSALQFSSGEDGVQDYMNEALQHELEQRISAFCLPNLNLYIEV